MSLINQIGCGWITSELRANTKSQIYLLVLDWTLTISVKRIMSDEFNEWMPILSGVYCSDSWTDSFIRLAFMKPALLHPWLLLSFFFRALKGSPGCQESKEREARGWVSSRSGYFVVIFSWVLSFLSFPSSLFSPPLKSDMCALVQWYLIVDMLITLTRTED